MKTVVAAVSLCVLCAPSLAGAQELNVGAPGDRPSALPPILRDIDIDERLGSQIDSSLAFTDAEGRRMHLSDYFGNVRPTLLVLAYYKCPMLCGLVSRGVVEGLRSLDWKLGDEYRVVTVSFDPRDTADAARRKQTSALAALGRPEQRADWPFLVGEESQSRALADAIGFKFAYDPSADVYAHPAVVVVLTPAGRISRYLYGTEFSPRDLRLGLLEASQGKVGTIVDRVLLTCYRYDPASRKYGPYILGFMRLGGLVILGVVAFIVGGLWAHDRRRRSGAT